MLMKNNKSPDMQVSVRTAVLMCALQAVMIAIAIYYKTIYLTGCGAVIFWIGIFRLWFIRHGKQSEDIQRRRCKLAGLVLFLPVIALYGLSIMPLFVPTRLRVDMVQIGIFCVLIAMQAVLTIISLITNRANKEVVVRVLRHFDIAILCVLLAALVSRLLLVGEKEEWAQMVCLTGCVMGVIMFLLECNMLLCAICGYRTTRGSIRLIRGIIKDNSRKLHYVSVGKDGVMVFVKLVMSIISFSFFMFANVLFSCGIGIARYTALMMQGKDQEEQLKLYAKVALILSFSGICYVAYSVRLFFGGSAGKYDMVMAIAIACYTFVEFGIQIRELIKLRREQNLEAEALRLISFSGILVSFVLTQTALMSFSEPGEHNFSDGLAGVVFGGLVVLVGLFALLRYSLLKRKLLSNEKNNP